MKKEYICSLNQVLPVHTKFNTLCNNHFGFWKYQKGILLLFGHRLNRLISTVNSICIYQFNT